MPREGHSCSQVGPKKVTWFASASLLEPEEVFLADHVPEGTFSQVPYLAAGKPWNFSPMTAIAAMGSTPILGVSQGQVPRGQTLDLNCFFGIVLGSKRGEGGGGAGWEGSMSFLSCSLKYSLGWPTFASQKGWNVPTYACTRRMRVLRAHVQIEAEIDFVKRNGKGKLRGSPINIPQARLRLFGCNLYSARLGPVFLCSCRAI